jgi:hypothetical protein
MSMTETIPEFADPAICGEDLKGNLKRAISFAPENCDGCADYHIVSTLKRLTGHTLFERGGRPALLEALRSIFSGMRPTADGFDVVVTACADTGVLSTCSHAAWAAGEEWLARSRFTVLDRCRTPLMLCEEYASRNGLKVRTEVVDLLETSRDFPADLILVHNFLPFVPADRHHDLLRRLGRWLKPDGCVVIWQPVLPAGDRDRFHQRQKKQVSDIAAVIESGTIEINEPKETLVARLERNVMQVGPAMQNIMDAASLKALIGSVGFDLRSFDELFFRLGGAQEGAQANVTCIVAVAGLPKGAG